MGAQVGVEQTEAVSGPHVFTEAVLEAIGAATWPDGSLLVDVAPDVLRAKLAPQILSAAYALAAISAITVADGL